MESEKHPMTEQMRELLEYSETLGVLKFLNYQHISTFNLAFRPYETTKKYHENLGVYQLLWQKLFVAISNDREFVTKLFEPLRKRDQWIERLMHVYSKTKEHTKKDGIAFARADYYDDLEGQPKLTQYNLFSLGMQSNQEQFQEAAKIMDPQNKDHYADCQTIRSFANCIEDFTKKKSLKGLFLFVGFESSNEKNMFDQMRLKLEIMKKNIKVKRITIQELAKNITKDKHNDLFYKGELVSLVYYRVGHKVEHFSVDGDVNVGWKAKEDIETSNAYSIPSVVMELINQKKVQTQLTKPEVIRKFLPEEEAAKLEETFVKQWQFVNMNEEQFKEIRNLVRQKPQAYILKPNLEGGGNNFYGKEALAKLQSLSLEECHIYILMQKIFSKSSPNQIIDGKDYITINCLYEISRYGAFNWYDNKISFNEVSGFLLRAKPEHQDQGGIMTGIGSIVPWKLK